ncbi:HAD-IA family hydrolase [Actinomadura roseirufa]|uniref:HAD-IA family hydrolase n=1 Tax=Actinomadura roseirufa TaxID=2094049 RepID=UPI00104131C0|nr:HAD-IA family hydrolase [Actinomadura roseirufa]
MTQPAADPPGHRHLGTGRALLIDLDGVLVDSMPAIDRIFATWARDHGLDPAHVTRTIHGRPTAEALKDLVPLHEVPAHRHRLAQAEITASSTMTALPGAQQLLSLLPPHAWAIVTSGERSVAQARINATGLPSPPVLVSADDVTRGKPDPECYLRAAARIGAAPSDCWVIEDADSGLAAAHAAGMHSIGLGNRLRNQTSTEATIRSLDELTITTEARQLTITIRRPCRVPGSKLGAQ